MRSPLRRRVALSVFAAALLGVGASSASAESLDRDFVTGESGGEVQQPESPVAFRPIWVFDASSGPSGENATGTVRLDVEGRLGRATIATWDVTCLSVAGHQATIGAVAVATPTPLPTRSSTSRTVSAGTRRRGALARADRAADLSGSTIR